MLLFRLIRLHLCGILDIGEDTTYQTRKNNDDETKMSTVELYHHQKHTCV